MFFRNTESTTFFFEKTLGSLDNAQKQYTSGDPVVRFSCQLVRTSYLDGVSEGLRNSVLVKMKYTESLTSQILDAESVRKPYGANASHMYANKKT